MFWLILVAGAAIAALQLRPLHAHPHAWIDVQVVVLFDDDGAVVGLRQNWLFDEFYTAFATEGLDADGDGIPDPGLLDALSMENINNLASFDYFTSVKIGEAALPLGTPTEVSGGLAADRYVMSFVVPLAEPARLGDAPLTYAVYDPTYYVELLHAEREDAIRLDGAPTDCTYSLIPPDPDPEMVTFAASLGQNESAGDGLGILFAERVSLQCTTGS